MKQTNKHIQFEVSTRMGPMSLFGGAQGASDGTSDQSTTEGGYEVATEEDIRMLESFLGGF
ncbi:hypothetical protein [Anaerovirgula multivorans]|nr:hypothetical protein [Anaerovirgula multivorans]